MKLLLSVSALLLLTAASAIAQQKGLPAPLPDEVRMDHILALAAIEAVQKDLGVGDDVARKLTLLNEECQAAISSEFQSAGLSPPSGPGRVTPEQRQKVMEIRGRLNSKFVAQASELLSTDQIKRLQQIRLQGRLRTGPRAFLAPEVASELKLTDDQKQSLNALNRESTEKLFPGGAGMPSREFADKLRGVEEEYAVKAKEVLSVEQKEALNRLKGNEFDLSKLPYTMSRAVFPLPAAPTATARQKSEGMIVSGRIHSDYIVTLAANEAVQKELGVSNDVARELMLLRGRDYRAAEQKAFQDAGITSTQDRMRMMARERPKYHELVKQVNDDLIPKLKELLTAEQYKRLQQIQFQNRFNNDGPKTLLVPEVAIDLNLADDQKLLLDALSREFGRRDPIPGGPRGGYLFEDGSVKHGEEYRTKALELLTAEQKEALKKLEGKEFDLSAFVIYSTPPPPRN